MPRPPRTIVLSLPHHVTLRGNNRRKLFAYGPEYQTFLSLVANGLSKTGCALHALSLMTNHVHMLVTPFAPDALPAFVQSVSQRFAQYRNPRRGGTGKLFEQRYVSRVADTSAYLAYVTAYIDLNPHAAGLSTWRGQPYPFTTLHLHAGRPATSETLRRIWTPSSWYLSLGLTHDERAANYEDAVRRFANSGTTNAALGAPPPTASGLSDTRDAGRRRRVERPDGTSAL